MPFCKVNYIRLSSNDPRAQHCGERNICDISDYIKGEVNLPVIIVRIFVSVITRRTRGLL